MVLHKRLDYGSSGHRVPAMPRVPKSAKGKRSVRKKVETNEMCAFDLLATVAGTLLEAEIANSPFNHTTEKDSIKQEKVKSPKAEVFDRGSCSITTLGSEGFFHIGKRDDTQTSNTVSGHSSIFVTPDKSDKDVFTGKSIVTGARGELGQSLGPILEKCSMDRRSPDSVESCKYKLLENIMAPLRAENASGSLRAENVSGSGGLEEHPMDVDVKPPPLVSSDSSVDIPLCGNHIANSSIPMRGEHKEHDDDENSSGCTHPSTRPCKATGPLRVGDHRIRKLLGSKYSKVATAMVKDEDFSDTEKKSVYRGKRMGYIRQRAQRSSFKRRKLCEHRIISASDREVRGEGTSNSPVNGNIKIEAIDSHEMHGVSGASSSTDQKSSYESGDLRVRFSIKSFKVPELFIEIPESATVGSLKKTVMEAVTAVLGGGVRIGVLQQGKKIRDDNKTLIQAGICHDDKMENLGFTLDPIPRRRPSLAKSEDFLPPCDDTTKQLTGYPVVVPPSDEGPPIPTLQPPLNALVKCLDSENNSAHSPVDLSSLDQIAANYSKALVPVSAINGEALAVVPLRKLRRAELAQRRIRRPFSVPEVEALVQAVEKLGTGRWRDVKIRAFDNAKHRTYVDLKDKWKTLVHTARISPQQRRGEPVPQVLLDRVLAAHAYWSQQQTKLQIKSLPGEACLLF